MSHELEVLKELLSDLERGYLLRVLTAFGLCRNLLERNLRSDSWRVHMRSWPFHSGYHMYPVNDKSSALGPVGQYKELPLWEGKQLELRINLIKHIIAELEKEFEPVPDRNPTNSIFIHLYGTDELEKENE